MRSDDGMDTAGSRIKRGVQIPAEQYVSAQYGIADRMASYGHQIREVMRLSPRHVLEIGIGPGIVSQVLRKCGVSVTTLDHAGDLCPDIVASVTDLPLADQSFDLVLCCEVLEHLSYDGFEQALSEIHRVTSNALVMTLPDVNRFYRAEVKLPLMSRGRRLSVECPFAWPRRHVFDGEHYWEIGKRGFPLRRICRSIEAAGFRITNSYRVWEIPWHRMLVAEKTSNATV